MSKKEKLNNMSLDVISEYQVVSSLDKKIRNITLCSAVGVLGTAVAFGAGCSITNLNYDAFACSITTTIAATVAAVGFMKTKEDMQEINTAYHYALGRDENEVEKKEEVKYCLEQYMSESAGVTMLSGLTLCGMGLALSTKNITPMILAIPVAIGATWSSFCAGKNREIVEIAFKDTVQNKKPMVKSM